METIYDQLFKFFHSSYKKLSWIIMCMQRLMEEKRIMHYSSRHRILLVGEGDFSFSVSLATAFGNASNMVATSFDSKEMLLLKYGSAAKMNVDLLESKGCTVLHDVDAHSMARHYYLRFEEFDRIVYNFPHAGFIHREDNLIQILLHKDLVRGFLTSASNMLTKKGQVHVTHKTKHPYSEWEIEELGEEAGLRLTECVNFYRWQYPGYINRRGAGNRSGDTFRADSSSTYKFKA